MTEEFILEMKKRLLDEQREVVMNLNLERSEYDELVRDQEPNDTAGIAQNALWSRIAADLGVADQKRLRQVRAALDSISNHRYGTCAKCGREIPRERLEAIPYAPFCIDCEQARERFRRMEEGEV